MIRFWSLTCFIRGISGMAEGQLASQTFQVPDTVEAIEFYFEQGLTDGLPVVPQRRTWWHGFWRRRGWGLRMWWGDSYPKAGDHR